MPQALSNTMPQHLKQQRQHALEITITTTLKTITTTSLEITITTHHLKKTAIS